MPAKVVFWVSAGVIFYAYLGYPLLLKLLALLVPRPKDANSALTLAAGVPVSVIVTAHNEARVIQKRIENLLELDYPRDELEIILASDGSTDSTVQITERYQGQGATVLDLPRMGKGPAQNEAVACARGEIVVLTDADTEFDPGFVRAVVSHFLRDRRTGCVAGNLKWKANSAVPSKFREVSWNLELDLREAESRLGILAGASGAAMAMRKELWRPMTDALDDSDSVAPLDVILQGRRVALATDAIAYDRPFSSSRSDFKSKIRGVSKSMIMIPRRWGFPNVIRHPVISWVLLSHYLARWIGPYFMFAVVISSCLLFRDGATYKAIAAIEGLLGFLVLAGYIADRLNKTLPIASHLFSFANVNAGFAIGILKGALGAARGPFETE